MVALAKRGSGTPVTSGTTWTAVTSAVDGTPPANPATYAVWTSSASGATAFIEVSGYDFSAIEDTATLNSVTISLRHFENNTTRIATVTLQAYLGATPVGTALTCTRATAARSDSTTVAVTLAQLKGGTFKVRATATRAAVTQSATFNVDQIDVTADYTPLVVGGNVKHWTGSAWVDKPVKHWTGSAWAAKPVKHWTGSAWVLS
jgi:hypothetical protein